MSTWRTVGSVVAGTVVTVVMVATTIVLLPVIGFGAAELVGNWLPIWLFLLPVVFAAVLGGVTTGALQGATPGRSAILGGVATGLGLTAIGAVLGLLVLGILLGMTPAHGQVTGLARATRTMLAAGGVAGLVVGAVFGAFGGAGGCICRRKLSE